MYKTCPTCKMKIKGTEHQRCPRCYTILMTYPKCEDCKGCSVIKACKK